LDTPSTLSLGIKHSLNEKLMIAATYNQTDWSSVGTVPVTSQQTGQIVTLSGSPIAIPFEYQDTTYTSIGADYSLSDNTTIRAGIGLDETVTSDSTRTTSLPVDDRYWFSLGATHKLQSVKGQIDWGYTYVFLKDEAEVNIGPGHVAYSGLPYSGKADPTVHILSVSYKRTF